MLTPEQVVEIRCRTVRWSTKPGMATRMLADLLADRADIAQELEKTLSRKAEPGYSMTKALTALIERIK